MSNSLVQKIKGGSLKAAATAAIGATASIVLFDGLSGVNVFSFAVPKFVATGGTLFASSIAADFVIPMITPYTNLGLSPALSKFENSILKPVIVGAALVAIESIVAPEAIAQNGGVFKNIILGGVSNIGGYYILDSTGLINNPGF